jgi:NADH:ubiquinone oxidoreductase subunit 2 (subunit N)
MIVGRIAPLAQTNIKRLLAYSSVGHMGLLLMPLCGNQSGIRRNRAIRNSEYSAIFMGATPADSIGVLWAYMIIYVIINVGVWGLLFWPIYRPVSLFRPAQTSTSTAHRQKGNSTA